MKAGDRVRLNDASYGIALGTVEAVSPAGNVRVVWDHTPPLVGRFSPGNAAALLEVVTGPDARQRHEWPGDEVPRGQWTCRACGVTQTDENEDDACEGGR